MPGSKEIERRIESNAALRGIMNAMKAFAGLNLRKTSASLPSIREYERNLKAAFADMTRHFPQTRGAARNHGLRIIVLFGSDMGLCGLFNERLADFVGKAAGKDDAVFVVGKKLAEKLDLAGFKYSGPLGSATTVEGVGSALVESFSRVANEYMAENVTDLAFVYFGLSESNDAVGIVSEKILPLEADQEPGFERRKPLLYLPPELVIREIIGEYLYISFYRCFMESLRAENWFRFRSMDGALENLDERIKGLDSLYKFFRQEEITEELIEVIESHSLADSRASRPSGGSAASRGEKD
ncbi:MAG: F0F1 ATP synthase subunit gamma [Nitrospinae bacterium]|nr:F0F1 ATP synthase subunit gamma [Nitrospinota bacterium]